MDLSKFNQYLDSFNSKDYDKVADFWAPKFEVFLGDTLLFSSREELKEFYGFLHSYVTEEIIVERYLSDDHNAFLEARVRITANKTMTKELIDDSGFHALTPIEKGVAFDLPQFIHYNLEDGKLSRVLCVMSGPPIVL